MFARKPNATAGQIITLGANPNRSATGSTLQRSNDDASTPLKGTYVLDAVNSDGVVIIGKGTRIVGQITDCARLEIQGVVEGSIVAESLVIRASGVVTGELQAIHAEVHGRFEGRLEVREVLDVRGTGRVEGELSYGKLAVAMGGHIAGNVSAGPTELPAEVEPVATTANNSMATNSYVNGYMS